MGWLEDSLVRDEEVTHHRLSAEISARSAENGGEPGPDISGRARWDEWERLCNSVSGTSLCVDGCCEQHRSVCACVREAQKVCLLQCVSREDTGLGLGQVSVGVGGNERLT